MGKRDERPTQRHIVTGNVSENRTWHSTGRLDEGEEEESAVMREARAGRGEGRRNWKRREGGTLLRRRCRQRGRGKGGKGKGVRPKCRWQRTRYGCNRSWLRWTQALGGRF